MSFDIKIVGGSIVDGTGGPSYQANIGIREGRIVEIGACHASAQQLLQADGAIVTPGFVDLHCHYDGQASWDSDMAPSSQHGVTTCVMGNCGVGFAPVRPSDHDRLIGLMEGVEDIPGTALAEGLSWQWESFAEYLSALDARPHTIDIAGQVPHDALRVFVMGERGLVGEDATEDDIQQMKQLLREALEAGAVGFSTGRTDNHRASDGRATPASEAKVRELQGLAQAFHGLSHGVMQAVSDFDMNIAPERFEGEFDVLEQLVKSAGGHALSISLSQRDREPGQWKRILGRVERASAEGLPIRVQVAARAIGVMLGLEASFHPFMGFPSYKKIALRPLAQRVTLMRVPAFRHALLSEQSERISGEGSPIPPLADQLLANLEQLSRRIFRLGEHPNYEPEPTESLFAEAQKKNITPREALYDALLERDGHELLYFPLFNYSGMNLDAVGEMLRHPLAMPGLSDGGAHVGTVCDASFPTFMLTHWVRDRQRGRLPLERVIRMMSHDTAEFMGFKDRGSIEPGKRADINIIDMSQLRLKPPHLVRDLPAGGQRFLQHADGYRATLVNGVVTCQDGRLTGAYPGRVVRLSR